MITRRFYVLGLTSVVLISFLIYTTCLSKLRSGTLLAKPKVTARPGALSQHVVICKVTGADTSWVQREIPDLDVSIYVVDDPSAEYRVPKNKGRENMAYLTYIIDNYDALRDIEIFLHSDQSAWHNNDLLDDDSVKVLKALKPEYLMKVGYTNLRCHHEPGCPDWLHVDLPEEKLDDWLKLEERYFTSTVWNEMHPGKPIPYALSQPAGNQFAVTKQTIRSLPRSEYIRYRTWLLETPLQDKVSGRFFEYAWQYIFLGKPEVCPPMNQCYCAGFGVCFGGASQFDFYFHLRAQSRKLTSTANGMEQGRAQNDLREQSANITKEMKLLLDAAFIRGEKAELRAKEA